MHRGKSSSRKEVNKAKWIPGTAKQREDKETRADKPDQKCDQFQHMDGAESIYFKKA